MNFIKKNKICFAITFYTRIKIIKQSIRITKFAITSIIKRHFYQMPFIYPMPVRTGVVTTESTGLNLRAYPSMTGQVVGSVPPRAQLTVYGQTDGWYSVAYGDLAGYVRADYVRLT